MGASIKARKETVAKPNIRTGGQHFEPWQMTQSADKHRLNGGINDMTPHRKGRVRHPAAVAWENMLREADTICDAWLRLSGFYSWWLGTVTGDEDKPYVLNLTIASRAICLNAPDRIHASPETALWLPRDVMAFAMDKPDKGLPRGISKRSDKHRTYDARVRGLDPNGGKIVHWRSGSNLLELELWCQSRRANTLSQLVARYAEHPEIDRVARVLGHFV